MKSLALLLCLALAGCTLTRVPIGKQYFTRVSLMQEIYISITDPETGITMVYSNDGGQAAAKSVTAGVIMGSAGL